MLLAIDTVHVHWFILAYKFHFYTSVHLKWEDVGTTLGSSDSTIIIIAGSKQTLVTSWVSCGRSEFKVSSCIGGNFTSFLTKKVLFADIIDDLVFFLLSGLSVNPKLTSDEFLPSRREALSPDDKTLATEVCLPGKDENEERALFMMAETCLGNWSLSG